ncbi:MAG: diacylglycerol/lipid kinase family protein [Cecembia sp.]
MNYFIVNPISGSISKSKRELLIQKIRKFPESKILFTKNKNHAIELAKLGIENGAKKIIAVGGDGTVREIATALVNTDIPLAIIPLGSGNGLARHLKIPKDFDLALSLAMTGKKTRIDIGEVNGLPFLCTAGFGFDALVAQKFSTLSKRGLWGYFLAIIMAYRNYKSITIVKNSKTLDKLFILTFANSSQFGNEAYISPESSVLDGHFEMVVCQTENFLSHSNFALALFLKNLHKSKRVRISKLKNISFTINSPFLLHLDGDYIPDFQNKQIIIKNIPKSLSVIY